MRSTEIDYDNIVRLTNWKLQLDAQPNMSTRVEFAREWENLSDTERFLCKVAKGVLLGQEVQLQISSERADSAVALATHLGADVKRRALTSEGRIELVIYLRSKD